MDDHQRCQRTSKNCTHEITTQKKHIVASYCLQQIFLQRKICIQFFSAFAATFSRLVISLMKKISALPLSQEG